MKQREPRRKVLVSARLRDGLGWTHARILNVSSRGLLMRSARAPSPGTYVEVCRGHHHIVARVMWVNQDRFGVHTQDSVAVDAIAGCAETVDENTIPTVERRSRRRTPSAHERLERSRKTAAAMQFAWIAGLGAVGGILVFDAVSDALERPLRVVSAELGRN